MIKIWVTEEDLAKITSIIMRELQKGEIEMSATQNEVIANEVDRILAEKQSKSTEVLVGIAFLAATYVGVRAVIRKAIKDENRRNQEEK